MECVIQVMKLYVWESIEGHREWVGYNYVSGVPSTTVVQEQHRHTDKINRTT